GPEQRPEDQSGYQRAPVAQVLAEFLEEDAPDRLHPPIPWGGGSAPAAPTRRTNASSSDSVPARPRSSAGVPCPTTRPWAMTTTSSHKAEISCMTWLEKRMQCPSSRSL